jgi:hypothetical protein
MSFDLSLKNSSKPILLTVLSLVILNIASTTLLSLFGLSYYVIPFHILIILYLGFKIDTPYLPLMILFLEYVHSSFTAQGWEIGTIAGVIISISISYLREILHLNSFGMTVVIVQIFQFIWFLITSVIIYMRTDLFSIIIDRFWRFLPESIFISILAPILFIALDKIWIKKENSLLGDKG